MHIDKYLLKLFPMIFSLVFCLLCWGFVGVAPPAFWNGEILECKVRRSGSKPEVWLSCGQRPNPIASSWRPTSWGSHEDWVRVCIRKPTLQSSIFTEILNTNKCLVLKYGQVLGPIPRRFGVSFAPAYLISPSQPHQSPRPPPPPRPGALEGV